MKPTMQQRILLLALLFASFCSNASAQSPGLSYYSRLLIERTYDYQVETRIGEFEDYDRLVLPYSIVERATLSPTGGSLIHDWKILGSSSQSGGSSVEQPLFAVVEAYGARNVTLGNRVGSKKLKANSNTIEFTFAESIGDNMLLDAIGSSSRDPITPVVLADGSGQSYNLVKGIVPFRLSKQTRLKLDFLKLCLACSTLFQNGYCGASAEISVAIYRDVNGNGRVDLNESQVYGKTLSSTLETDLLDYDCLEIVDDRFELPKGRYILVTSVENRFTSSTFPQNIFAGGIFVDTLSSVCVGSGSISIDNSP